MFSTPVCRQKVELIIEVGSRGSLLKNKLYFDINAFFYKLKNAIVQRQNPGGADYFENAGSAKQNGLETFLSYELINSELQFFNHAVLHVSDTWNNFHYDVFKQLANDYSGKKCTRGSFTNHSGRI